MAQSTFTDKNIDRIRNIHHGNFLDYLSSAYEVLRKIFSYLPLDDLENVSKAFEKWRPIIDTTIKQRTVIESFVFCSKDLNFKVWSEANFCLSFFIKENKTLESQLKKYLKPDAQSVVVESQAGVIGTPNFLEVEEQDLVKRGLSFPPAFATHIRIPPLNGVGVKTFTWNNLDSFEDFRKNFSLPDNKIVKCIIILMTNREARRQKDDFILFLQSRQSESFAVGGCLVDSFQSDNADTKYIVFYGNNVEASSIVLERNINTKEKIYSKVEELKETCSKTDQGVVFVFRCFKRQRVCRRVCREQNWRKELNKWEEQSLTKYFPMTPVIGCFGYGEFGTNHPDNKVEVPLKRARQSDIMEYSYSTSIVYVGFKH